MNRRQRPITYVLARRRWAEIMGATSLGMAWMLAWAPLLPSHTAWTAMRHVGEVIIVGPAVFFVGWKVVGRRWTEMEKLRISDAAFEIVADVLKVTSDGTWREVDVQRELETWRRHEVEHEREVQRQRDLHQMSLMAIELQEQRYATMIGRLQEEHRAIQQAREDREAEIKTQAYLLGIKQSRDIQAYVDNPRQRLRIVRGAYTPDQEPGDAETPDSKAS